MNAKVKEKLKKYHDRVLAWHMGVNGVTRASVRRSLVAYEKAKREFERKQNEGNSEVTRLG